ncbi:MAG: class I SAM-dependent methyltransferase [Bacillota bacterium]|nr:class I SAM-dependent methyltransferase [Bacillota bacterium]
MEQISKAWDWNRNSDKVWYTPSEDSYYLINRWKEKGFSRFLDLGCGRGRHSIQFAKAGFEVNSVDLSEVAVNGLRDWAVKEKLSITAEVSDIMKLPYEDNTFDCLLAYHVISHTDSKGIVRILSEIKRVLKDGAEFYITFCSKSASIFKDGGLPMLDFNTIIKLEDGPENNVPHFHADERLIEELLSGFKIITVRHVQDVIIEGSKHGSWHYFVLGKK